MLARTANCSELFVSFQGEGAHAGRRQLFVRFAGCPLRCQWCDTPESLVAVPACRVFGIDGAHLRPNPLTVDALDAEVTALKAVSPPLHAIAVTGGEPLSQADFLVEWLAMRRHGLPVLLETAGILPDRLARVLPHVAIVSLDFKLPSNSGERPLWGEHEACLRLALAAGRDVYVKMPVDEATDPDDVVRGARLAAAGRDVPLFLTPLTAPQGVALRVSPARLERLQALASLHHPDVRVLPQLHKVLGIL
jgi:7-carboxy-7-deazaguanine synthase